MHALSFHTWVIHISSVLEWMLAIAAVTLWVSGALSQPALARGGDAAGPGQCSLRLHLASV